METLINIFFHTDDYTPIEQVSDHAVRSIDANISYTSHSLTDLRITVYAPESPEQVTEFVAWVEQFNAVKSVEVWSRVQA